MVDPKEDIISQIKVKTNLDSGLKFTAQKGQVCGPSPTNWEMDDANLP
jgi:hypothetical protein